MLSTTTVTTSAYEVIWEKLPDDFALPNYPVDNINQPTLAAALTESLRIAHRLAEQALTPTNYWLRWWDGQGNLLLWDTEQMVNFYTLAWQVR